MGAQPLADGRTRFRVWAPQRKSIDVALHEPRGLRYLPLEKTAGGYFEGTHAAPVGAHYKYRLDGGETFPDPCSRFQPEGPHGPSRSRGSEPLRLEGRDWRGVPSIKGQVIYELHVGTFTPEGTYAAAAAKLPLLKELGVTVLELMPLHTFPGRYNWGYDGVDAVRAVRRRTASRMICGGWWTRRTGWGSASSWTSSTTTSARTGTTCPSTRGVLQPEVSQRVGRADQLR